MWKTCGYGDKGQKNCITDIKDSKKVVNSAIIVIVSCENRLFCFTWNKINLFHMKLSQKKGAKNHIGAIGEEIAADFLKKKGFKILDQNYLKKWGEIDLVAHGTSSTLHFIEVKTISHETKLLLQQSVVARTYRPEENVTREKVFKLNRAIQSWLEDHKNYQETDWQIDVITVRIVPHEKYATVKYLDNVII